MAKDYYKVLGIERDASGASIKEAYRKLAFEYHPDRNRGDSSALERMKEINEAYAVLSDVAKRQRYDALRQEYGTNAYDRFRQGYSEQDIFRGSDINQIFEEMAKAFGFRNFEEVFRESYGTTYQSYQFRRPGIFGRFIIIRPGGHRGTIDRESGRERLEGAEGDAGRGSFLGNLAGSALRYLAGRILGKAAGLESLDRKGSIEITPEKAEKGGKVPYSDPETSRKITITVPAATREGQVLRLRGMGVAGRMGQRGDLYLMVHVKLSILARLKGLLSGKEWSQWAR